MLRFALATHLNLRTAALLIMTTSLRLVLICCIILLFTCPFAYGQPDEDLLLQRGRQTISLIDQGDSTWSALMDGTDFILLPKRDIDTLLARIKRQRAVIERHEEVIAAQREALGRYEDFEMAAKSHVDTMKGLIEAGNDLYTGYQDLYNDLKDLQGISSFSLTAGIGLVDPPLRASPRLTGIIGAEYRRTWVQAHLGRGSWGAAGVRISF